MMMSFLITESNSDIEPMESFIGNLTIDMFPER